MSLQRLSYRRRCICRRLGEQRYPQCLSGSHLWSRYDRVRGNPYPRLRILSL